MGFKKQMWKRFFIGNLLFSSTLLFADCAENLTAFFPSREELLGSKIELTSMTFPTVPNKVFHGFLNNTVPVTMESVEEAYAKGLYPYHLLDGKNTWFLGDGRGILDFKNLHISASTRNRLRKLVLKEKTLKVTFNQAFAEVLSACAESQRYSGGEEVTASWISEDVSRAYNELFKAGKALSVEVWQEGKLVGGSYGVYLNGVFSSESMFKTVSDAGKIAFLYQIALLKKAGLDFMDVQVVSDTTQHFNAVQIAYPEYFERMAQAQASDKSLDVQATHSISDEEMEAFLMSYTQQNPPPKSQKQKSSPAAAPLHQSDTAPAALLSTP
jgi:leucyl/phenylalanyl-tRNA--protein transferase